MALGSPPFSWSLGPESWVLREQQAKAKRSGAPFSSPDLVAFIVEAEAVPR